MRLLVHDLPRSTDVLLDALLPVVPAHRQERGMSSLCLLSDIALSRIQADLVPREHTLPADDALELEAVLARKSSSVLVRVRVRRRGWLAARVQSGGLTLNRMSLTRSFSSGCKVSCAGPGMEGPERQTERG